MHIIGLLYGEEHLSITPPPSQPCTEILFLQQDVVQTVRDTDEFNTGYHWRHQNCLFIIYLNLVVFEKLTDTQGGDPTVEKIDDPIMTQR